MISLKGTRLRVLTVTLSQLYGHVMRQHKNKNTTKEVVLKAVRKRLLNDLSLRSEDGIDLVPVSKSVQTDTIVDTHMIFDLDKHFEWPRLMMKLVWAYWLTVI